MTPTWPQIVERAFEARRAWQATSGTDSSTTAVVSGVDVMVLSLLLDLRNLDCLLCHDRLCERLVAALASTARPVRSLAAPDGSAHLRLVPLHAPEVAGGEAEGAVLVAYGARGFLAWRLAADQTILPLGLCSAALWRCGLALVAEPRTQRAAQALADALAHAVAGAWIDPMMLLERTQRLSARLRAAGLGDDDEPEGQQDRIAQLEAEVAMLRRSALLRQRDILAERTQPAGTRA